MAALAILLTTLVLTAQPVDAIPGDCVAGVQVQSGCVIEGPAPTTGLRCPVNDGTPLGLNTIGQDGDLCFGLISRPTIPGTCLAPYFVFSTVCLLTNPVVGGPEGPAFECPPPLTGEAVVETFDTINGQQVILRCEYEPFSAAAPCPSGTTEDPAQADKCRRPVFQTQGPVCTTGHYEFLGRCFRTEALPQEPALGCSEGTLFRDDCVIVGDIDFDPSFCPTNVAGVFEDGLECFTLIDRPAPGECPAFTTNDSDPDKCRRPTDLFRGDAFCETGFSLFGSRCLQVNKAGLASNPTGPPPARDCASGETGRGICQYRPVLTGGQAGAPVSLQIELCAGALPAAVLYDSRGSVALPESVSATIDAVALTEGPAGVYAGSIHPSRIAEVHAHRPF